MPVFVQVISSNRELLGHPTSRKPLLMRENVSALADSIFEMHDYGKRDLGLATRQSPQSHAPARMNPTTYLDILTSYRWKPADQMTQRVSVRSLKHSYISKMSGSF